MEIETEQQFEVQETEQQTVEATPEWLHQVQVVVQEHQDQEQLEELHEANDSLSPPPDPLSLEEAEASESPEDDVSACEDLNVTGEHSINDNDVNARSGTTFKCNKCKRKFRNPNLLEQHLRLHITSDTTSSTINYKCPECEEVFSDYARFMQHRETHGPDRKKKRGENIINGQFDGPRQGEEAQVGEGVQNIGLTPSTTLMNALCSALTGQADGSGQTHPATANVKPGGSDGIQIELPTQVKAIYFNTQSPNLSELMNFMLLLNCKMDAIIKHFNVPNVEITTVKTQPEEGPPPPEAAATTPTTPTSTATVTTPSSAQHSPTSKEQQQQDYYASTILQSGTLSSKQWLAALSPYSGIIQQHGPDQVPILQSPVTTIAQNTSAPTFVVPEVTVEKVFLESRSRGNFAKHLTFQVFSPEERRDRNCTGRVFGRAVPKGQLDPVKLNAVKEATFRKYPCHPSLIDITWKKEGVTAIDAGLRSEIRIRK